MASPICTPDDPTGLGELHRQVNAGPGTAAIEPSVASIGRFAPKLSGSADRINAALRGTGVSWQGRTAEAAAADLTGVARWASAGGDHAGAGGGQVQAYADSFAELRAKVARPEPVPSLSRWDSVWETFGVMSDHGLAVQQNHRAAVAALDALEVHQQNTDRAITGFPDIAGVPGSGSGDQVGAGGAHPGSAPTGRPDSSGTPSAGSLGAGSPTTSTAGTNAGTAGTSNTGAGSAPGGGEYATNRAGAGGATPGSSAALYPGGPITGPRPGAGGGWPRGPRPGVGSGSRPGTRAGPRPDTGGGLRPGTGSGPPAGRQEPMRSGYRGGSAPPPTGPGGGPSGTGPAPRTGTPSAHLAAQPAADPHGGPAGTRSPGGYGPMMGGVPAGSGGDRTHRNQHFIPSDEPFVVQFEDVAPPVLGAGSAEDR